LDIDLDALRTWVQFSLALVSIGLSILIYRQSRKTNVIVATTIIETLKKRLTEVEEKLQEIMFAVDDLKKRFDRE
jgi:hypothetical protein